jgi:hypothetical protein
MCAGPSGGFAIQGCFVPRSFRAGEVWLLVEKWNLFPFFTGGYGATKKLHHGDFVQSLLAGWPAGGRFGLYFAPTIEKKR